MRFVNGINPYFTDGVEAWRQEGLQTMRDHIATILAPNAFSTAPLVADYL